VLPKIDDREAAMNTADLRGSLIAEHKRCGKPNCRCARGKLHGQYYYRRWRDADGVQRKAYVPRTGVAAMRRTLTRVRASSPKTFSRELKKLLDQLDGEAKVAKRRMGEKIGRYWHGKRLRDRRSFPAEQRDRALYRMNREQIVEAFGWEITEGDFVLLQGMIRSERKRRNRLGLPWTTVDPRTGEAVLHLVLNLWMLPSYREHAMRYAADTKRR
jgi:hypothetical protein